jgi:cation transport ATPase
LIAARASHRRTVDAETTPRETASVASSVLLHRDSGSPGLGGQGAGQRGDRGDLDRGEPSRRPDRGRSAKPSTHCSTNWRRRLRAALRRGVGGAVRGVADRRLGRRAGGPAPVELGLQAAALAVGAWTFVPSTLRRLAKGKIGVGTLMTIAAVGAVILGEAAMLAFLFSISEGLEEYSLAREWSGVSVSALDSSSPAIDVCRS